MANKQSFTPEEWTKILESPMVAGIAVSAADPSGVWGSLKEAFASSSALASAKLDAAPTNWLGPSRLTLKPRKEGPAFRRRCASALPMLSLLTASSVRLPTCARCHRYSMPKRLATQPPSKLGC